MTVLPPGAHRRATSSSLRVYNADSASALLVVLKSQPDTTKEENRSSSEEQTSFNTGPKYCEGKERFLEDEKLQVGHRNAAIA